MAEESKYRHGPASANSVDMDIDGVVSGIYKFREATQEAVEEYLKDQCFELEEYMRENRPWTDRTHLARKSLSAEMQKKNVAGGKTEYRVKLESPVPYGADLEHGVPGHSRPYPIIEPTLRLKGPEVVNGLKNLLNSSKVKSRMKGPAKPKASTKK